MELPGADLIEQGISDLAAGRETVEALVVSIPAIDRRHFRARVEDVAQ
jgi:hypothetical protein